MKQWKVKQEEPKEYQTTLGRTDYNIPMFGYRSALLIFVVGILTLFIIPPLSAMLLKDYRLLSTIVSSLIIGFFVAYSQFFLERKKGLCTSFYVTGILVSAAVGFILFTVYYGKVLV